MTENDIIKHRFGNTKGTDHLPIYFSTLGTQTDLLTMPVERKKNPKEVTGKFYKKQTAF